VGEEVVCEGTAEHDAGDISPIRGPRGSRRRDEIWIGRASMRARWLGSARGPLAPILLAPSIVAIAHWNRLMGGLLYAASPRLPWSQLLRRTFAKDVEQCPKCHGRLRLIQSIAEPGVPTPSSTGWASCPHETPTAARARDPTDDDARNDDDDT